jgi:hypothetical protein
MSEVVAFRQATANPWNGRGVNAVPLTKNCANGKVSISLPHARFSSAADLKFLQHLQQARSGTSNREVALES